MTRYLGSDDIRITVEDFEEENEELLAVLSEMDSEKLKLATVALAGKVGEYQVYLVDKAIDEEGRATFEDWDEGITLIPESSFTDYCEELVVDLGELPKKIPDYIVIDWDATAENLKSDYASINIGGVIYLGRG